MMSGPDCEAARELIPELSLGIADGRERAEVFEHLFSCADCRRFLAELSEVSDELLLLAPAHEPPVGFESHVIGRLGLPPERNWLRPRLSVSRFRPRLAVVAVAAALLGSAVTASALVLSLRDDRQLASQYRAALERVGGQYFQAARLFAADGTAAGKVFGYQGEPSWLFVIVYPRYRHRVLTGHLITARGRRIPVAGLRLDERRGSWGGAIPIELRDVARVELHSGTEALAGNLPPGPRR
jgi:putative zinc finger protein